MVKRTYSKVLIERKATVREVYEIECSSPAAGLRNLKSMFKHDKGPEPVSKSVVRTGRFKLV